MAKELIKKEKMVGWYDPGQLADTGKKTVISTIIGEYADPRAGAADPTHGKFFDYSLQIRPAARSERESENETLHDDFRNIEEKRDEIWIDYVADVGDGWNSTYAVAYNLAIRNLPAKLKEPDDPKNKTAAPKYEDFGETPRGEILVFGGDGVYPTASTNEYENRLNVPYSIAFNTGENGREEQAVSDSETANLKKKPHVFAIPGNHDWYDSLTAFKKIFCSEVFNKRMFGGWQTRQKRSYFAIKLPHDWWLLGVDLQLAHSIDLGQLEYFSALIEGMNSNSKVILCVPEPYWIRSIKYDKYNVDTIEEKEKSIQKLEDFLEESGAQVKAYIAGDLHHYRRLEDEERTQKITAGGGGAFLHPTHDFEFWTREEIDKWKAEKATEEQKKKAYFSLEKSYPEEKVSKNLDWMNICFLWNNPLFGVVTLALYPIVAWLVHGEIPAKNLQEQGWTSIRGTLFSLSFWYEAWLTTVNSFIDIPILAVVIVGLLLALILFTDSKSHWYKWVAGGLHGISHLTAIFFLGWFSFLVSVWISGVCYLDDKGIPQSCNVPEPTHRNVIWFLCVLIIPAVGGYIIGSIIMGIYLFISLHVWGRHDNEAFSALKIEDYKNFLRLHISKNGTLTVYPFKIEKVSKEWKEETHDGKIFCSPDDGKSKAELIEKPVKIG
jgi:hypothetical protein